MENKKSKLNRVIVIGHKNPDTDSIVSSIVAQKFFEKTEKIKTKAFRAGSLNNETRFILNKFKVNSPELLKKIKLTDEIILVDHNEKTQIAEAINFSQVIKIIDHHKVFIQTEKPLSMRVEPLGSTASLLAKMYQEAKKKLSKLEASLLLSGIISDTLNLVSPTTTTEDKKIVRELNKIAKLNLKQLVKEMFLAKSSLQGLSIEDIISQDYKQFQMEGNKVGIGVWETASPKLVEEKQAEIFKKLKIKKQKEKLSYLFFFVVDIIKQFSVAYIIREEEAQIVQKAFGGKVKNNLLTIKNVVSRKKQIVPQIEEILKK